jgi:hypothetical protein
MVGYSNQRRDDELFDAYTSSFVLSDERIDEARGRPTVEDLLGGVDIMQFGTGMPPIQEGEIVFGSIFYVQDNNLRRTE